MIGDCTYRDFSLPSRPVSRRAKILLTSLALLVLGGATFYGWLVWSTANPLRLRVVDATRQEDGSMVVRYEVSNDSLMTVKFLASISTFAQPLRDPLASAPERVEIRPFPDPDSGPHLLRPKETLAGIIHTPAAVSCQLTYQWEAGMMNQLRSARQGLARQLPDWLSGLIPATYAVKSAETEQIPVPRPQTTVP